MKIVVKGENYTEVIHQKGEFESVQYWRLKKPRKQKDCGVWEDGVQICTWKDMMEEEAKTA